jgi:very-short-patch-repair endonuclease
VAWGRAVHNCASRRPQPATGSHSAAVTAEPAPAVWQQLLLAQDHVLARAQALSAGMTEDAWQWWIERGGAQRLLPGVAVGHRGEPSRRQCAWAAVLHCGAGAALTGDMALIEHGMRLSSPPTAVHVAVPPERVVRRGAVLALDVPLPVVPQRCKGLDAWRHPVRQPPTVRVPVAALHAAAHARSDRAAEWRIAAVAQQRLTTVQHLRDALEQMPRLPRRALVTATLLDVEHGAHAGSELAFLRLLRKHGLPEPDRLQRLVRADGKRYLDVWWERQRVAVEVDGAHHVEVGQWDDDVLRANDVVIVERHDRVLLLRFTTGNLRHDERAVVRQLRAALL